MEIADEDIYKKTTNLLIIITLKIFILLFIKSITKYTHII